MKASLRRFKDQVEQYLMESHPTGFRTPKYHILEHYFDQLRRFGSLLNGDTDATDRIHCTVKDAFELTNKRGTHHISIAQ
jgi:hypothetical protein